MSPRFANVSCSQCGEDFGPGDNGFSHCDDHPRKIVINYDPKPIPYFGYDYTAQREGDTGEDLTGHGATEAEAIADLLDREDCAQDEAEARARKAAP